MKKILLGLLFTIYSIGQTPKEVFQELIKQEVKYPKIVFDIFTLEFFIYWHTYIINMDRWTVNDKTKQVTNINESNRFYEC